VVKRLRAPDGCPWDIEQTPESTRANLIEEAYECVEAINEKDPAHIREELGDVFLLATMLAYMYEQEGAFSVSDSLEEVSDKLIRRHPHVFGDAVAADSAAVLKQWDEIKVKVEGRKTKDSVLDKVSRALPPLERAYQLQKKAAKVGFDWLRAEDVWDKVAEELTETREACGELVASGADGEDHGGVGEAAREHLEEEIGDLLFSVVNISRFLKVDPAVALHRAIGKFDRRFRHVEKSMKARGHEMCPDTFAEMDALWDEAKKQ
jgi:tetrapyrrole methylase family protein/MazG family protein